MGSLPFIVVASAVPVLDDCSVAPRQYPGGILSGSSDDEPVLA